jgi:hypothetical protein
MLVRTRRTSQRLQPFAGVGPGVSLAGAVGLVAEQYLDHLASPAAATAARTHPRPGRSRRPRGRAPVLSTTRGPRAHGLTCPPGNAHSQYLGQLLRVRAGGAGTAGVGADIRRRDRVPERAAVVGHYEADLFRCVPCREFPHPGAGEGGLARAAVADDPSSISRRHGIRRRRAASRWQSAISRRSPGQPGDSRCSRGRRPGRTCHDRRVREDSAVRTGQEGPG